MAQRVFLFSILTVFLAANADCQTTIAISANGFSGLQRFMAPGSIMGTMTIGGGNGNYNFQDPNQQFSILRSTSGANQAWIINRVALGPGSYIVPLTVTDTAGLTATSSTTITVT